MKAQDRNVFAVRAALVCATLVCAMMMVCAGCGDGADGKAEDAGFEIDKLHTLGPLTVYVRIDKKTLTIAETLLLELEATIAADYEVQMPQVGGELENFGIIDWDNLGNRLDENNNVISSYRYRLEPFLSGTFSIPAFKFEFGKSAEPQEQKYELETEPIDIEVTSLLGAERAELVIADIEDVVEMPKEASYIWYWLVGIVCVCAVAVILVCIKRNKRIELVRIFKPAHELAYERLRALVKRDLVKAGMIKEFYEEISDILRHYIEHRFDLRAPERTTEEFLFELGSAEILSLSDKQDLGEFLRHCDLVKFAKHKPEAEQIQKTFDLVKDFIEKTRSDERRVDVTDTAAVREDIETVRA